jgi:glucosamine--fructose-6-phosphate aminotransferase (isomerizing)
MTPWLSFEEGIAVQPQGLTHALSIAREWNREHDLSTALGGRSLLLVGIGASHAALASPLYELRRRGVTAARSTGGDLPPDGASLAATYVGVSQSGRSRETLQALQQVDPARRVSLVNAPGSPMAEVAEISLDVGGITDSRMSSVAYSATVLGLGVLADLLTDGAPHAGWDDLPARVEALLADPLPALVEFAERTQGRDVFDVVGAAPSLTAAEQGALLFREGPFIPSLGTDTRSYLHGPMDCAGPGTAHVLLGREREAQLADQLAEKNVPVLLVTDRPVTTSTATVIRIPEVPVVQRSILESVVLQRLVAEVSRARGLDVERRAFTRQDTKVDSAEAALTPIA